MNYTYSTRFRTILVISILFIIITELQPENLTSKDCFVDYYHLAGDAYVRIKKALRPALDGVIGPFKGFMNDIHNVR